MKKHLFLILLVGVCFGQSIDSEKHLKVLYPVVEDLNKKLKKLMEIYEDLLAVETATTNQFQKETLSLLKQINRDSYMNVDWIKYNTEIFLFVKDGWAKQFVIDKNTYIIGLLDFDIKGVSNNIPFLKNPQGIHLSNKMLDLIRDTQREANTANNYLQSIIK